MGWSAPHPSVASGRNPTMRRERMRTKPIPETAAFGIDIGKKVFHVVALNASGAVIASVNEV